MPPESPLAELDALNRAKRQISAAGAAGTPDIPYLYELYLQQQQGDAAGFGAPAAMPEDEPGGELPIEYRTSPGAEAQALGLGFGGPAAPGPAPSSLPPGDTETSGSVVTGSGPAAPSPGWPRAIRPSWRAFWTPTSAR